MFTCARSGTSIPGGRWAGRPLTTCVPNWLLIVWTWPSGRGVTVSRAPSFMPIGVLSTPAVTWRINARNLGFANRRVGPGCAGIMVGHEHTRRRQRELILILVWCCVGDGGGASTVVLQEVAVNHRELLR